MINLLCNDYNYYYFMITPYHKFSLPVHATIFSYDKISATKSLTNNMIYYSRTDNKNLHHLFNNSTL